MRVCWYSTALSLGSRSLSNPYALYTRTATTSNNRIRCAVRPSLSLETFRISSIDRRALQDDISAAYEYEGTDGILALAKAEESILTATEPSELLRTSLEATKSIGARKSNKAKAAGIFNAWIASCMEMKNHDEGAEYASRLLEAYDNLSENMSLYPDVVTLCLVYSVLSRSEAYQKEAGIVLERAIRMTKKQAGSKRRKVLAASRRKSNNRASDCQDELQAILGPDFEVLHESDAMLIINKPSGISCFHGKRTGAGRIRKGSSIDASLEDALVHCNVPLSTLNADAMGIVHRLDRGTSGCIALAKTHEMHAHLMTEFFLRRSLKTYTVLTSPAPDCDERRITGQVDGRPAKSAYKMLERFNVSDAALGSVKTFTGRKHQVRVHCAQDLKSPVVGDALYGNASIVKCEGMPKGGFFLHASTLSVPTYDVTVEAPLPSWWNHTLNRLREAGPV